MKTALLLGAGASVFVEIPTTKILVREVLDRVLHREKWESPEAKLLAENIVKSHKDEDVEKLYDAIHTMIDAEKQHQTVVEYKTKLLGDEKLPREIRAPELSNLTQMTVKDETSDIDETIKTLESLEMSIRNTLLDSLVVKPKHFDTVVFTYNELFKSVSRNIVTTNYDNVLETYCEQAKLNLVNGFKRSYLGDRRMWDNVWKGEKNSLHLTKLHGSITWQKDTDDIVLEIGRPGLRDTDMDVMIAPTLAEKDYGDGIFPQLMSRFRTVLGETEQLIVVGFSFRDSEINLILRSCLKRTDENRNPMKLLYVDPNPEGLRELVGPNAEIRKIRRSGMPTLSKFCLDEMPYVYAYQSEFNDSVAASMGSLLAAMRVDCT